MEVLVPSCEVVQAPSCAVVQAHPSCVVVQAHPSCVVEQAQLSCAVVQAHPSCAVAWALEMGCRETEASDWRSLHLGLGIAKCRCCTSPPTKHRPSRHWLPGPQFDNGTTALLPELEAHPHGCR